MLVQEYTLDHLSLEELLNDIKHLLELDTEKVKNNQSYYKKLYDDSNTDSVQLRRFYTSLERDQQRLDFFKELIHRLETLNYKMILLGIEHCIKNEKEIQGKEPENYQIIVRKEGNQFKT